MAITSKLFALLSSRLQRFARDPDEWISLLIKLIDELSKVKTIEKNDWEDR